MPSIKASQAVDRARLAPAEAPVASAPPALPPPGAEYGVSPYFQCSLPPLGAGLDLNARQFWGAAGRVPQERILPPPNSLNLNLGTAGAAGPAGAPGARGAKGKDGGTGVRLDIPLTVNFSGGNPQATGTVHLGRTFTLLQVKASAACRVRLYSTAAARTADLARDSATYPPLNADHGVVLDLNLDATYTFPELFRLSPAAEGADLEQFAAGDIAYTVDGLAGGSAWGGDLAAPAAVFCGGSERQRRADVSASIGNLLRFAGRNGPNDGYNLYFLDAGGVILSRWAEWPNSGGGTNYPQIVIPPSTKYAAADSDPTCSGFDPSGVNYGHLSSILDVHFQLATSIAPVTLTFTLLREEGE